MKKILITGGAGFIGSHVVRRFVINYPEYQIVNLARTTLRNIIGTMNLADANSKRDKINQDLMSTLAKETGNWGIVETYKHNDLAVFSIEIDYKSGKSWGVDLR